MSKNMDSTTKLTEFAPLSPVESSQPVVATLFSKLFGYGKSSGDNAATSASVSDDGPADSEDSESWKQLDAAEKNDSSPPGDDDSSGVSYSLDASEGRSLPNVLKRISNIVALRSGNLKSYKDSELRNYWMPDSVAKQCYDCGERFTTFRRRHHCRVCGQIFCWKCCSDEIPGKIMGCIGDLRVCTYCCKVALSYLQSSDMRSVLSADLKALQEGLQVKYGSDSNPPRQQRTNDDPLDDETRAYRKASVGYMEEKYALGRSSSSYLGTQGRSLVLKNSAPLRMIYEELFRSSRAIQLQTHRVRLKSYYNCFVGNELINWLMANNKTATRAQAAAIAQALLEAGFIESAQSEDSFGDGTGLFKPAKLSLMQSIDLSDENQSTCDSQEPAWVTNIPQHDSTTDSESDTKQPSFHTIGRLPSSSSSFYLDLNVEASTATLKRPTSEDLASITTTESSGITATATASTNTATTDDADDYSVGRSKDIEQMKKSDRCSEFVASDELLSDTLRVQEFNERNSWHRAKNLSTINEEITSYNAITAAYRKHEYSLIGQLLKREGLAENWTEPIISLARQIVDQVRPDLHHNAEDMDIRQYVQIKTSPGGCKNDCEIVSGVVCSKNVAHRGMNAMIAHPKILLLQCGLMYQRVEGKLLSLEPVMLQENEYLGHTVSRITALGPDIVLVHRSVSRLAQDRFRQRGVTLVLNVKLSVLERVARCTGGTIVNTIDAHLTTRYKLGTCKKFYLRNFPAETNRFKTLMYFEGCPNAHLGATILLRGGNLAELKRVKKVTSTMIFAAYSSRLEISFLMDEFARPPFQSDDSFLDDREKEKEGVDDKTRANDRAEKSCGVPEDSRSIFDVSPPGALKNVSIETKKLSSMNARASDETGLEPSALTNTETLKRVSSLLDDDCDPYDTLRLFKSRPKLCPESADKEKSSGELKNSIEPPESFFSTEATSEKPGNPENPTGKLSTIEKIPSEEKRAHCESISDQSDPLHQYLRQETDDEDDEDEDDEHIYADDEEKYYDDEEIVDELFASGKETNYSLEASSELPRGSLSVAELPLLNKFKKALDERILSFSPYLKFTIPYLETPPGRRCLLRRFFPKDIYRSAQLSDNQPETLARAPAAEAEQAPAVTSITMKPRHEFVRAKLTSSVEARSVQALLANFRASGSRLYSRDTVLRPNLTGKKPAKKRGKITNDESIDCLEPENHQRLSVLFCSFSHCRDDSPAVFCVNPWIVNMDLYGRNDIALGGFLERYCLTDEYECPAQSCRAEIASHARRFAHDDGCIYIILNSLGSEHFRHENNDQILMWSRCTICKIVSPVVPMSSDTWSLSFAKYLELRFHAGIYARRGAAAAAAAAAAGGAGSEEPCRHSLHHDHCQYFTRRNMLATFKYAKITQWEISLPPPLIRVRYGFKQYSNVIEEIKMLGLKGDEVFTSIREKLLDAQIAAGGTCGAGSIAEFEALKQQLAKEQQYLKGKIDEIQLKITSPRLENKKNCGGKSEREMRWLMFRIEDGIVIAKRLISEAVTTWNARIQEITAVRKKDDRAKRFNDNKIVLATGSNSAGVVDNDGYATEDAESQIEDSSPVSADYNAVDAVNAASNVPTDTTNYESNVETLDNDFIAGECTTTNAANPDDIVVAQEKFHRQQHQRSHSDVFPITGEDLVPDRRKKKKTILSQLLPSTNSGNLISNPLASFEHHSLPLGSVVPMVVYETEPSSIIAYALDSHDYKHALAEIIRSSRGTEQNTASPLHRRKLPENREFITGDLPQSGETRLQRPSVLSFLRGNSPSPASPIDNNDKINIATAEITSSANNTASSNNNNNNNNQNSNVESEDPEKKATKAQTYIQVQFHDTTTNFYCRIYFAAQFAALRENVLPCGEDGFTRSLCRSVQWAARGGKSGSAFCKSRDDRFILKELSRLEMQIFLDFAPNYFAYMEKCQRTKEPTLLGKIVGVYRVSFKNNTTNAALRTSVLVMENLFYGRTITDKFDLKGSVRNRLVNPEEADSEGELVLLDENLLNMSCDSPLYIKSHSKAVLNRAIELDTKFLADNSVMDYSLLVGLEPNSNELVLGIIDYIRTFTWDKKLETMVKKSGILGGQGKLPTIVSPEEYRARFIAAMDRYFLPVPDRWTGLDRGLKSSSTS